MTEPKFKLLAVDDESGNLELLRENLQGLYQLSFANNGCAALEIAKKLNPDLILLDVMMPEIDGFETCTRLKQDPQLNQTPIIFLTALDAPDSVTKGLELGAVDYVVKPFNFDELQARVKTHLEMKHNREIIANQVLKLQHNLEVMTALSETGALVTAVAHDAKKFTNAISTSLEGLIIPVLRKELTQSENWVMNLMNDVLEVHTNSVRCTEFLDSLLAINRKSEEIEPISAIKLLQQAFSLLEYNLMQEKIDWILEFDHCRTMMILGNTQLIRVFMNLIANALEALKKHDTPYPKITARIEDLEDRIMVSITDNGPGIKPDILESIRRGIVVTTKGQGGNTFGISGAAKIIKTLNGTIDIESTLGQGATFIITLPKVSVEHNQEELFSSNVELF